MAVQRVEPLLQFAAFAVIEAAVGQHAVHVEHHQAHGGGAIAHGGGDAGQDQRFGRVSHGSRKSHSHTTLAAIRSCICKAPSSAPSASSTSIWLSRSSSMC
ncbi:hypothetical protein D3C77_595310 [compost metagenome]